MNNLIERLNKLASWLEARKNKSAHKDAIALRKAITALSPVLPDDVAECIEKLKGIHHIKATEVANLGINPDGMSSFHQTTADMLERQAREVLAYKTMAEINQGYKDREAEFLEDAVKDAERIEELEEDIYGTREINHDLVKRIEELEEDNARRKIAIQNVHDHNNELRKRIKELQTELKANIQLYRDAEIECGNLEEEMGGWKAHVELGDEKIKELQARLDYIGNPKNGMADLAAYARGRDGSA